MIAAVILAAGRSRRMGRPKMGLVWKNGQPVIAHMVSIFEEGGAKPIVVVVGENQASIEELLSERPVQIALASTGMDAEMIDSVKAGLKTLQASGIAAALIMPGDHPLLRPATVRALCDAWRKVPAKVVIPSFAGRRGHPLLIPRTLWSAVLNLAQRESLRDFLNQHAAKIELIPVDDPGIRFDMDTPEDYERALNA